jgi:predicted lipoprotein with Yx(FWY)xxD motif
MPRSRSISLLCLLVTLGALIAGCGGDSDSTSADTGSGETRGEQTVEKVVEKEEPAPPKKGAWGAVFAAQSEDMGILLFDLSGHTLYRFSKDRGAVPTCYGPCAKRWPPALTEGKLRAVDVPDKMVRTTKRRDGTVQLTYDDHPLYTFSGDRSGEINGHENESFGGKWYALRPSGADAR